MLNLLPAVLIGGPSHLEKSELFYSLTKALRERHILHHALRVHAASEKTRLLTSERANVRFLPIDDSWNDKLTAHLSQDLSQRLVPLLVDIGADNQHLQACILQQCTHSILLFHEHDQVSKTFWFQLGERYGLIPLACVSSSLENNISTSTIQEPMITGTFMSLEHDALVQDPLFHCLVERIASLFDSYSQEELTRIHLRQAPGELPLHLSMLLHTIAPGVESWEPSMLCALFEYIPSHISLSVYGQGPQWLYAALAAYTQADEFYQFDPCLLSGEISSGWMASPPLLLGTTTRLSTTTRPEVHITYIRENENGCLTVRATGLDYVQATTLPSLPFPPLPSHLGLILAGSMPTWLLTALVRLYIRAGVIWIACHQAQQCRAIVIFSQTTRHFVGEIITTL